MTALLDEREGLPTASPWRRYELCSGSYQLTQQAIALGQEACKKSEAADSGDRIHAWLEAKKVELSQSEMQTAQFLKERADDQVVRIFGDAKTMVLYEQRYWLELDGKKALSGKMDRVVYTPELALIQDYKTGFSEPDPAEQNAQLKVLAVLFAINHTSTQEVVVQIISGPYGVTEARYNIAALSVAYEEIVKTLQAINSPNAPFSPSPEACRYCGANLICQAVKDTIAPVAREQYSALPVEPERAARLLDEVAVIKGHVAEIEKFYFEKLSGDPAFRIPGYGLVPGAVRREVTDWHAARQRLEEFIDVADLQAAETYQLGDLEKALARKFKLKAKDAKTKLNEILAGLVEEKQNQSSLKRVRGEVTVKDLTSVVV
jgi:Protein of unknown function (DUF2800)